MSIAQIPTERDEAAVLLMARAGGRDGYDLTDLTHEALIRKTALGLARQGLVTAQDLADHTVDWLDTVPGLSPWRGAALKVAEVERDRAGLDLAALSRTIAARPVLMIGAERGIGQMTAGLARAAREEAISRSSSSCRTPNWTARRCSSTSPRCRSTSTSRTPGAPAAGPRASAGAEMPEAVGSAVVGHRQVTATVEPPAFASARASPLQPGRSSSSPWPSPTSAETSTS